MEYAMADFCQQCKSTPLRLREFNDKLRCLKCGSNLEQTVPDSFADIFAQKMSFSNYSSEVAPAVRSPISSTQDSSQDTEIVYSISQHYHHSAHLARAASDISLSDTTRISASPKKPSSSYTLTQNGVDPSSLLRSQIALFEQSNDEQRARLLELWRLAPPEYTANGGQELADGKFQIMTFEQEEELALLRHQRNMQRKEDLNGDVDMDQVSSTQAPLLEDQASSENVSLQASSDLALTANDYCHGGFNLEQQVSTEYPGWQLGQQYVEHQYGMFDQMNR